MIPLGVGPVRLHGVGVAEMSPPVACMAEASALQLRSVGNVPGRMKAEARGQYRTLAGLRQTMICTGAGFFLLSDEASKSARCRSESV